MSALAVVAGAAIFAALVAIAGWIRSWRSGVAKTAGAAAVAEHNDQRADAAEAVADRVTAAAAERQGSLEERIRHDAQARIDRGDPGDRDIVQAGWAARHGTGGAAGDAAAVPAGAAGGAGSDPAGRPPLRGRR